MLTWDLPTWDENNVTWDGMSHLGIWDGMSHYGKKLFHKTLIYTNVSAFYVMQTLLYKLVVHVEHTLSVRFCRGWVDVLKGPDDGGQRGGRNIWGGSCGHCGACGGSCGNCGGGSRCAVVERAPFIRLVMVAGASGVVEGVNILACCSWGAPVYKGITTEYMGYHFPSGISHQPEDGAVVIHVVPCLDLRIHNFMDQVVTLESFSPKICEGMNLCRRLHLWRRRRRRRRRLQRVIKRTSYRSLA